MKPDNHKNRRHPFSKKNGHESRDLQSKESRPAGKPPLDTNEATIVEDMVSFVSHSRASARLLIIKHNRMTTEHLVTTDVVTIGRDKANILVLDDQTVSPFHLQIRRDKEQKHSIHCLDPRNPIVIHQERILHAILKNGDEITIGPFLIIFRGTRQVTGPAPFGKGAAEITPSVDMTHGEAVVAESQLKVPFFALHIDSGPTSGDVCLLDKPHLTIGRAASNDIVINDRSISRTHALLTVGENEVTINDLGSMNGIEISGHTVPEAVLKNGDVVKLGQIVLHFTDMRLAHPPGPADDQQTGEFFSPDAAHTVTSFMSVPLIRYFVVTSLSVFCLCLTVLFFGQNFRSGSLFSQVKPHQQNQSAFPGTTLRATDPHLKQLIEQQRWEEALACLDHMPESSPDNRQAHSLRQQVWLESSNSETLKLGKRRLANNQPEDAVRILGQIPQTSIYYQPAYELSVSIKNELFQR